MQPRKITIAFNRPLLGPRKWRRSKNKKARPYSINDYEISDSKIGYEHPVTRVGTLIYENIQTGWRLASITDVT